MSYARNEERGDWFKLLACSSHVWPVQTCETCWNRVLDLLEQVQQKAQKGSSPR